MKYPAIFFAGLVLTAVPLTSLAVEGGGVWSTMIEISPPLPPPQPGVLSTVGYSPTETEKPFLARVNETVPESFHSADISEYSLAAAAGKYVGWFGIVREISPNSPAGTTRLLVEHKYFDGLTDSHLQVVSLSGAGDFTALLEGDGAAIPPLGLVAIYGTVDSDEDGLPRVRADYIRVWDWGRFTFMDYGPDKSNPRWVALRRPERDFVYSPRPTGRYYEALLGPRPGGGAPPSKVPGPGRMGAGPAKSPAFARQTVPVTILYTSGSKGRFSPWEAVESRLSEEAGVVPGDLYGGYAAAAAYIRQVREETEGRGGVFLLVDGGASLVGSVEGDFFRGRSAVEFMNRVGYHSVTVAARDWSLGTGVVEDLAGRAAFPFLGANVVEEATGALPPYLKPYTVVEAEGLKIGIIGYGQRRLELWVDPAMTEGLKGDRPNIVAKRYIDEMRELGVELVVALDHSEWNRYLEMPRTVEGIDILIHGMADWTSPRAEGFAQEAPLEIGETRVFPEVDSRLAVGRIDLVYDRRAGEISEARGERHFLNLKEVSENPEIKALADEYAEQMGSGLEEVIGEAGGDFTLEWDEDWNASLGTLICDAMRWYAGTDVAIQNVGAIRQDLQAGPIRRGELETMLPFKNNLVTFRVRGRYIYFCNILQRRTSGPPQPCIYVSGARLDRKPNLKVNHITINGEEIEKDRYYTFATNSYIHDTKILEDRVCQDIVVRDEEINDIVIDYLREHSPVSPAGSRRKEIPGGGAE